MRRLCIVGITGKMGKALLEILRADFAVAGFSRLESDVLKEFNAEVANAEAVIDFSHSRNLRPAIDACVANGKPYFCGTTGLTDSDFGSLKNAGESVPVLYADNTAFGVAVLKKALRVITKELGAMADIEISETHHRAKKDAPSGTALGLGAIVADALGHDLKKSMVTDRTREPRGSTPQIGFTSLRGGNVVGEHAVRFFLANETISVSHECNDRAVFAQGAVKAALWLINRPRGFYSMEDMFNGG